MSYAIQWVRSLIFTAQAYLAMAVFGIAYLPWAIVSADGAARACKDYTRWVRWTAGWMVGLHTEIRGKVPTGQVMIAAKHQSFLDVMMIYGALPRAKFIMKKLLMYAPILGWFAWRLGCVFVDRGKRGQAIKKMVADVSAGKSKPGQLVIYPQGTRIGPNDVAPYKVGTAALYRELDQPCVPVAGNVGVFWPKRGIYRKPGVAVVEFLPPIPPGMNSRAFMAELERVIEERSDALAREAGVTITRAGAAALPPDEPGPPV